MIKIPQIEPYFGQNEAKALSNYMKSGGWVTEFKKTKEFEEEIKKFTNAKYCFAVNNGTISLTIAILAMGLKTGDEVLVPNYTMIATPNSIKLIGAKPIFVDIEKDTLCLDFTQLKKKINSRTKGIILVNPNGRFPKINIDEILDFCKKNNLFVIEDSAQGLGSFYSDGTHMGLKGNIGSLSFSSPKIISTGQGGALITNNYLIANKIKKLKDFGRSKGGNDIHTTFGLNSKFTDIQAIIGIEQMKKLNFRIKLKKNIYKIYKSELKELNKLKLFYSNLQFNTPWFIDAIVVNRNKLSKFLYKNGIGTRNMYPPISRQKVYNDKGLYPNSFFVGRNGLWLPSSPWLTKKEIQYVCNKIKYFYK